MAKGIVNVYCCGGTGTNIGLPLATYKESDTASGFAVIKPYFIDTSDSNVRRVTHEIDFYHIKTVSGDEQLDGSGSIRKLNAKPILESIPDILLRFKPANLNIVISAGSGGSGSVIAPGLVTELLNRGENVVAVVVGSSKSGNEIKNTKATLESYDGITRLRKVPVAMIYRENGPNHSQQQVNEDVRSYITSLQVLFSREHHGLDGTDLHNWLYFTNVADTAPRVATLEIYQKFDEYVGGLGRIMSVATLAGEGQSTDPGVLVPYHTEGIVTAVGLEKQLPHPAHYALVVDHINTIHKRLDSLYDSINETNKATRHRASNITSGDIDDSMGGIVL